MADFQDRELRILLAAKPKDDLRDVNRLLPEIVPPGRSQVRRLYVHRPFDSDFFVPQASARFHEIAQLEFEAEVATREETERDMRPLAAAGFQVSAEVLRGAPAEEILREASLWHADLVAVRTRSAEASDNRIGGMASALLHHATCPVLTYNAVPPAYRIRRILIPVDFSTGSRRGTDWGLALAETTGAEPVMLHVVARFDGRHGIDQNDLVAAAKEEIGRWCAGFDPALSQPARQTHIVSAETTAEGILAFAREGGHDLIVLSAMGASALRAILLGSNARKVIRASARPVLVVPASNRVSVGEFLRKVREAPAAGAGAPLREAPAVAAGV